MTNEELEASIAADPDEAGMVMDWDSVTVEFPQPKADLHMRVDRDVLDFFPQDRQRLSNPHQRRAAFLRSLCASQ